VPTPKSPAEPPPPDGSRQFLVIEPENEKALMDAGMMLGYF
jgi:hypothetical protein